MRSSGRSRGNATVPGDAPIQPPQAFVDNIAKLIGDGGSIDMSGQAITHLNTLQEGDGFLGDFMHAAAGSGSRLHFNLSGNALSQQTVDALLQFLAYQLLIYGAFQMELLTSPAARTPRRLSMRAR
jgi:hypothetical protein